MPITPEQYKDYDPKKGKLIFIDPGEIDHDVPIDLAHVDALKQSLSAVGQLTPILVRRATVQSKGELAVVDGFHRTTALKELGMMITAIELDCTTEEFWTARIVSATQHEEVKTDRAALWVKELWEASPYTAEYKTVTAAISATDTGKATSEVQALVEGWTKAWGIANSTLRNWIGYGTSTPEKPKIAGTPAKTQETKLTETVPQKPEILAIMKAFYGDMGIVIEGANKATCVNMTKEDMKLYRIRVAETMAALGFALKVFGGK